MPTVPFTPNRQPSAPPPDPDDSDFAALKAADNQDSDWYRGQQTDPQGFFALTGQDAWAGLADFRRQTMDRIDQAAQTLTNRITQDTYRAIAAKRAEPVLAQAQAHAEAQRDQAWDEISQTRRANAIADGAANWQDQRLYTRHYGAGAAEVEDQARRQGWDQARRQGWDQARTQQAQQDYARDFTKAMVKQAATTDPQAARALLDRHGNALGEGRDQLAAQIDRHALFADARKTADAVLAQAGDHPLDTLLAQAATPDTPALQAETERMIKAGFRTRQQARQQADEETLKQAWAEVKSGQTPDQLPTALRDHPAVIGQWDALWARALGEEGPVAGPGQSDGDTTGRAPLTQFVQNTDPSVMNDTGGDVAAPDASDPPPILRENADDGSSVQRDVTLLTDRDNIPGYLQRLAEITQTDPEWTENNAGEVVRELFTTNPWAAEQLVRQGRQAGLGTILPTITDGANSRALIQRNADLLRTDPDRIPDYVATVIDAATADPRWAAGHAKAVSRAIFRDDPNLAKDMVSQWKEAGLTVGLYADGYQTDQSVSDILQTAKENGGWLASGADKAINNGTECVALVKAVVPGLREHSTKEWRQGEQIRGLDDPPLRNGTALATGWVNGRYPSKSTGNHALIYVGRDEENPDMVQVIDQYGPRPNERVGRGVENRKVTIESLANYSVINLQ